MSQWLKSLSASLCILTILLHLIPKGKFAKYVQFYGGLLLFLVASKPVWEIFVGEGELGRLLQLEFLKEEYYDLETSVNGLEELKNDQIQKAYQNEIRRQMEELLTAYEVSDAQVELYFEEENGYLLKRVDLHTVKEDQQEKLDTVCQEIAGVYDLDRKDIRILGN